ncbi:DNA sulfur modification protein DndB [Craurococcus roseus]|uniref:DNA sulfur modification protein DndB n=1 Tax=Craurococcus roseus TaxID=77585 RepID=A0ABN1EVW4_9PROT
MSFNFAVQKLHAFGSYGEFSIGSGGSQVRAQYLLTKIRPGQQGHWENQLASQMAPWREVFRLEELSFDELIQRDLDDSRVAHDLIPYLLGETGQHARFFPPVLAVLVPKREGPSGIAPRYPTPHTEGERLSFGDLFEFERAVIEGVVSPLGVLRYNPQRSAIVIVDGQHRAMAMLALHRQINKSWGADPFAPYYSHIQVDPSAVAHIELPVCIIFFPDLHDGRPEFKDRGIDLVSVCREIFIVVNRQAKQVSKSRELLLDDEDFAAFMMRRTLTRFKDRKESAPDVARIYSFAFGDSEADNGGQVVAGQLEFCSAVALHKMHAAAGFGLPAAFSLTRSADITDGRNVRNPTRPAEILTGVGGVALQSISRRSAKTHRPEDVSLIADRIGDLTDRIMLPLFDRLRPYAAHNQAARQLLEALSDPTAMADPVQAKCRSLLFDGAGNRSVFEEHVARLREKIDELRTQAQPVPPHLMNQLTYSESVTRALQERETWVKTSRSFILFNIDEQNFLSRDKAAVEADVREVRARGKAIFDALSTQAFQLGYLMAVLSHAELLLPDAASYDERLAATEFASALYLAGLNAFFAVAGARHRTMSGYVAEPRARAFEAAQSGFRGLLAAGNVRELNEKQWEFFRYVVLEIVHSRMASAAVTAVLGDPENSAHAARFRTALPAVLDAIEKLRTRYFDAAVSTAQKTPEFKREVDMITMSARAGGKTDEEVRALVDEAVAAKRKETLDVCREHLRSSLGRIESAAQVLRRLAPVSGPPSAGQVGDQGELDEPPTTASAISLEVAVAADQLQNAAVDDGSVGG